MIFNLLFITTGFDGSLNRDEDTFLQPGIDLVIYCCIMHANLLKN